MEKLYDYRGVSPQVWKLFSDIYGLCKLVKCK